MFIMLANIILRTLFHIIFGLYLSIKSFLRKILGLLKKDFELLYENEPTFKGNQVSKHEYLGDSFAKLILN